MSFLTAFAFLSLLWTNQITASNNTDGTSSIRKHFKRGSTTPQVPPEGYYDPLSNGGNMVTQVFNTYPAGLGEPLNIIISGKSDAAVLVDQAADGGLQNYFQSFGFGGECLGQHMGASQQANLGDGNGYLNETTEMRWDYGDPQFGTCKESIQGGDHFRYWTQNGPKANSGAIFMASSYELPLSLQHDIIPNGYNLGRDWLIGNMTQTAIPTLNLTTSSTFSGSTTANDYTYRNSVQYVSGLLQNTSTGINHYASVGVDGGYAIDGLVAVVEVNIIGRPSSKSAAIPLTGLSIFGTSVLTMVLLFSLLS
ncbi:hypothetical protein APHAL10511_002769 [Amanita phalloides]|nr:hypothetical protein APHAL10511_002769 [Amanita phalloides]